MLARTEEQEKVYKDTLSGHYGVHHLDKRISDELSRHGQNLQTISNDVASNFDQFHILGHQGTKDLFNSVKTYLGQLSHPKVLDLGCGLGGTARTLVSEFGCEVVGIDIVEQNIRMAQELTKALKIDPNKICFSSAPATDTNLQDASFDLIILQDCAVNVENKTKLFGECKRLLKSGGILAFCDVFAGTMGGVVLPTYWANKAAISFPQKPKEIKQMLASMRFEEISWNDYTANAIEWLKSQEGVEGGFKLQMGDNYEKKMSNTLRNFTEKRTLWVNAIFRRNVEIATL